LYAACLSGKFCSLIFDKHPFIGVVGATSTISMASLNIALAPCQHDVGSGINCLLTHEKTVRKFGARRAHLQIAVSPNNIQREKGNILKYCLEQMSVNEELRNKWNELLTPDTDETTSL
jgi:hypothetical protein